MAYKLIYVLNDGTQNYPLFKGKSNEPTNQKSPKFLRQRIRKLYYKTLGTSVIKQPIVSSV